MAAARARAAARASLGPPLLGLPSLVLPVGGRVLACVARIWNARTARLTACGEACGRGT